MTRDLTLEVMIMMRFVVDYCHSSSFVYNFSFSLSLSPPLCPSLSLVFFNVQVSDEGLHSASLSPTSNSHFSCTFEDEKSSVVAALDLVHVYPVVPNSPLRAQHRFLKPNTWSMRFRAADDVHMTKPTFIHAGWDDIVV